MPSARRIEASRKSNEEAHALALAEVANLAMSGLQAHDVMERTAELVVDTLRLDSCEIMEVVLPEADALILTAGAGLSRSLKGQVRVSCSPDSQGGYAMKQRKPIRTENLREECRFAPFEHLLDLGLTSGVTVPIVWKTGAFGVLCVHSRERRSISREECRFIHDVARQLAGTGRRRRREVIARSNQAKLQAILDTAADGIITINEDGLIESFNLAAERIFGYDASETLGRNISMLMPAPYRDHHDRYIAEYLRTGIGKIIGTGRQVFGLRKDGTVFPADLDISEVDIGSRRIFTGIVRDATARIQGEIELRRLSELKSEFVALVSHELRAPLTNLSGGLELIDQELLDDDPDASRRTLALLTKEVNRLGQLVESILDISSLDAGELSLNLGLVWLEPVVSRVVAGTSLGCKPRFIEACVESRLPPVWADEVYAEQALRNVIENSLKFCQDNETLVITAQTDGDNVSISITDPGPGIKPEEQERIFDAFYRGADSGSGKPGYGLGLYFARKFMEAQAGSLRVVSPAYEESARPGTTFVLSFPVAKEEEEP